MTMTPPQQQARKTTTKPVISSRFRRAGLGLTASLLLAAAGLGAAPAANAAGTSTVYVCFAEARQNGAGGGAYKHDTWAQYLTTSGGWYTAGYQKANESGCNYWNVTAGYTWRFVADQRQGSVRFYGATRGFLCTPGGPYNAGTTLVYKY